MTEPLYSYAWLRDQSEEDLINLYNSISSRPHAEPEFYLNELSRREQARLNLGMFRMTVAIGIMTLANVVLVAAQLLR